MTTAEAILAHLRQKPMQFDILRRAPGLEDLHFRHIDRELQKLRRAGAIAYDRSARLWRVAA